MITYEKLKALNDALPTIPQKGKNYVMVHARVLGFRELCPEGSITTEIIHLDEQKVVMKSTITDEDGRVLATGIASEKFDDSFITKTSAFEVCETSATGRALGMLGIGIDSSFASAEEVANAMKQQDDLATDAEKASFIALCNMNDVNPEELLKKVGWKSGSMTRAQHGKALAELLGLKK